MYPPTTVLGSSFRRGVLRLINDGGIWFRVWGAPLARVFSNVQEFICLKMPDAGLKSDHWLPKRITGEFVWT